ncbi:MAG: ATP-binding protein [Verrucomicrobiae bacterium]|nr:ATP-binding protein [Verrucomicrobiae bacterium]
MIAIPPFLIRDINAFRRLPCTPWHAIAEFVDNSTQSYFDHEKELKAAYAAEGDSTKLTVSIAYDKDDILRIADNAMGMSYDELERAMHVAMPPRNTKGRSKYGMGLKTAACWIGDVWTVRTKKLGETVEHQVTVDVKKIADGSATLPHKEIKGRPAKDHFTIVEIRKHNRVFHGRTLGRIKQFLSSMYRQDFRSGVLNLLWRGEPVTWEDDPDRFLSDAAGNGRSLGRV